MRGFYGGLWPHQDSRAAQRSSIAQDARSQPPGRHLKYTNKHIAPIFGTLLRTSAYKHYWSTDKSGNASVWEPIVVSPPPRLANIFRLLFETWECLHIQKLPEPF